MSSSIEPVATESFYAEGRGPSLRRVIWGADGQRIRALEFHRIDEPHDAAHLRHVRIVSPQVVMVTPEEVINYSSWAAGFGQHHRAAALDLGRSDWLRSFSPLHLSKCRHFQLLFYDELFDIICEGLEFGDGVYENHAG